MKQKSIVTAPDTQMNKLPIEFAVADKTYNFEILANVKEDEVYPVVDNWLARTKIYTAQSLVEYINGKGYYGFKAEEIFGNHF